MKDHSKEYIYTKCREKLSNGQEMSNYGANSCIFDVDINGELYVVKMSNSGLCDDLRREYDVLQLLKDNSILEVPDVVGSFIFDDNFCIVYKKIQSEVVIGVYDYYDEYLPSWIAVKCGQFLRKIHALNTEEVFQSNLAKNEILSNHYLDEIAIKKANRLLRKYEVEFTNLNVFLPQNINTINYDFPQVLGHCDLHRGNILINDNCDISVIDWGNAKLCDSCYDIAMHLQKMNYSAGNEDVFLDAYFGCNCDNKFIIKINEYRKIESMLECIYNYEFFAKSIKKSNGKNLDNNSLKYQLKLIKYYQMNDIDYDPDKLLSTVIESFLNILSNKNMK